MTRRSVGGPPRLASPLVVSTEALARVPLFDSLDDAELNELACWFDEQRVSRGVRLTGEGAAGYSFYVLCDGAAVVTSDGADLARLASGDFFGEVAILGEGRRTATVTTTEPSTLFVMFDTEFRRLQSTQPAIASRIEDEMRRRIAARA